MKHAMIVTVLGSLAASILWPMTTAWTDSAGPGTTASGWDMLQAKPEVVDAWKDMRFGMFICWGPITLTGLEIGWSRGKARPDQKEGGGGPTPVEVYDDLYKKWRP